MARTIIHFATEISGRDNADSDEVYNIDHSSYA
jgi:hypothetical protein